MRLYLVRHGEAKSAEEDPSRSLTAKGRRDAQKIAAFLRPLGLNVEAVWHSGKARAAQTAEILAAALSLQGGEGDSPSARTPRYSPPPLLRREGLGPTDPVEPVAEQIAELTGDLMIVGHLPFMAHLAALLLTGSDSPELTAFPAGAVLCLEGGGPDPWRIRWMIAPEILPS